jgi:ribosomal protein L18E
VWGSKGKDALYLHKLVKCLSKAGDKDRKILLSVAQKLVSSRNRVAQA